jgi:gamma-glutamylaminecyclotransferase
MRIFVYGTLKRGLSNHGWISDQQFISEARTAIICRMYDCGGFSGMVPVDHDGLSIHGKIWEADDAGRRKPDILEDVAGGGYALEPVILMDSDTGTDGVLEIVCTYIYKRSVVVMREAGTEWMV